MFVDDICFSLFVEACVYQLGQIKSMNIELGIL